MNTEILGVALQIVLLIVISYPLGKYIAKVYKGEKTWSDFMKPVERLIYKVAGVNPEEEMNWKQFLKALLILNAFWFVWGGELTSCCRSQRKSCGKIYIGRSKTSSCAGFWQLYQRTKR